jgi:hypothetical protein
VSITDSEHFPGRWFITDADYGGMNKIKNSIRQHFALVLTGATCLILAGAVLIVALTGAGGTSHGAASSTSTTTVPPAKGAKGAKGEHPSVHGAVTAISGDTWSVTVRGVGLTVKVTPQTKYGTKVAPMTATDFAVGNQVTVAGARTGTTVTATRVTEAKTAGAGATSTTVASAG